MHNLEHGAVVIQYGRDIPQDEVDEMVAWYRDDPNGLVIAPFQLGDKISLAAWTADVGATGQVEKGSGRGHLAKCPRFDEGVQRVPRRVPLMGPERFDPSAMQPGT